MTAPPPCPRHHQNSESGPNYDGALLNSEQLPYSPGLVPSEYDSWVKKHPNDARMMGGFLFFRYLQTDKSDLLDFRAAGSKWPIVHGSCDARALSSRFDSVAEG